MGAVSLFNVIRRWIIEDPDLEHFDSISNGPNQFIACACDHFNRAVMIIYVYDKYVVIHDPGYVVTTLNAHEPDFFDSLKQCMLQREHTNTN